MLVDQKAGIPGFRSDTPRKQNSTAESEASFGGLARRARAKRESKMELKSCTRGPAELRPALRVGLPPRSPGVLVLKPAECARFEVRLPQRYVFPLIVLASAWFEDVAEPEAFRGFCSAGEIGDRVAKVSPRGRIRDTAAKAYICATTALVRKAAKAAAARNGAGEFDLFERRYKLGYRIAECGLDVTLRRYDGSVS
jgi:hypothetical protein